MILESCQLLCTALHIKIDELLSDSENTHKHLNECKDCDITFKLSFGNKNYNRMLTHEEYINQLLDFKSSIPYKKTHANHPCSIWTREYFGNFAWLLSMTYHLIDEYKLRYSKDSHACEKVLKFVTDSMTKVVYLFKSMDIEKVSQFAQAMPEQYKVNQDAVKAYRQYYNNEKRDIATWSKINNMPDWFER